MDDAVAVALEAGPRRALFLGMEPAAAFPGPDREAGEIPGGLE